MNEYSIDEVDLRIRQTKICNCSGQVGKAVTLLRVTATMTGLDAI